MSISVIKNAFQEIIFNLEEFKGKMRVDIRIYNSDDDGEPTIPTKKGISAPIEQLPAIHSAVEALLQEAIKKNLLPKQKKGKQPQSKR